MFPIPWNFPFRKKNGDMSTIGEVIGGAGSELPPHGVGDAGKLLGVKANGSLEWSDNVNSEIQTLTNNLSDEVETRAKVSAHNLLPFDLDECKALNTTGTWSGNVYSLNGITFTVDEDGIISANGTASSAADFYITKKFSVKAGESYTLNGGLNNDGTTTQRIWVNSNTAFPSGHRLTSYTSSGANSTQDALANESNITVYIHIYSGVSLSDAVFKPMVRLTSDLNSEFTPYAMTNRELTEEQTVTTITGVEWNVAVDSSKEIMAYRIGKIVFVYGYWESTASIAKFSDILTGLPKPKAPSISSDVKNNMLTLLYNSNNVGAVNNQVATTANVQYFFSFTYLADD